MSELHAVLGRSQLGRLPEFISARRKIAAVYDAGLTGYPRLAPLAEPPGAATRTSTSPTRSSPPIPPSCPPSSARSAGCGRCSVKASSAPPSPRPGMRTDTRKSLVARRPIRKGQAIAPEDVIIRRPATGIAPRDYDLVLGRVAQRDIEADDVITWDMV